MRWVPSSRSPLVAQSCADAGVPLVVDAAQTVGRLPVPDGWSVLAASARKWGGPAGVGMLVVRKGIRWVPPWPGAEPGDPDQPGGLNLPAVVGAAAALRAVAAEAPRGSATGCTRWSTGSATTVAATVPDVEVVGDPDDRLPHLVTFSCLYVDGEALLHALDRAGFAVSSGSSCTASTLRPSHVLEAMGVLIARQRPGVAATGRGTRREVDRFLAVLPGIVADLRAEAGRGWRADGPSRPRLSRAALPAAGHRAGPAAAASCRSATCCGYWPTIRPRPTTSRPGAGCAARSTSAPPPADAYEVRRPHVDRTWRAGTRGTGLIAVAATDGDTWRRVHVPRIGDRWVGRPREGRLAQAHAGARPARPACQRRGARSEPATGRRPRIPTTPHGR